MPFREIHKTSSVTGQMLRLECGFFCQYNDQLSEVKYHAYVED